MKFRFILDLSGLNQFIPCLHFLGNHFNPGSSRIKGECLGDFPEPLEYILTRLYSSGVRRLVRFSCGASGLLLSDSSLCLASGFPCFIRFAWVLVTTSFVGVHVLAYLDGWIVWPLVHMSASHGSGSASAFLVWVPSELGKVPVGSVPGSELAGPHVVFLISLSLPPTTMLRLQCRRLLVLQRPQVMAVTRAFLRGLNFTCVFYSAGQGVVSGGCSGVSGSAPFSHHGDHWVPA